MESQVKNGTKLLLTDELVKAYLKEKGCIIPPELQATEPGTQRIDLPNNQLDEKDTSHNSIGNTKPQYAEMYESFRSFIENSIKSYKEELQPLLWPLFVHIVLELIAKGFQNSANAFVEQFRQMYEPMHTTEIDALLTIKDPVHIAINKVAIQFRKKVEIQMSDLSQQIFLNFLEDKKYMLLLRIINQYITVDIVSSHPLRGDENGTKGVDGVDNTPEIRWGILREMQAVQKELWAKQNKKSKKKKKRQRESELPGMSDENRSTSDEDNADKKLKKSEEEREVGLGRIGSEATDTRIPLPPNVILNKGVAEEYTAQLLSDLQKRAFLSNTSLPSISFYTFLNSYNVVNTLSISSDGSRVAAGGSDSIVRLWNLKSEDRLCSKLIGHSGPVHGVAFSPCLTQNTPEYILSSSEDGTIRLWSMETQTCVVCYKGPNAPVWSIVFSPLGFYFATASHDTTARLWSTDKIYPLRIFAGHTSSVDCVCFHPNCNYIATGSLDKTVRLWDIETGNCIRLMRGHTGSVRTIRISPDGQLCASGGEDKKVVIFDLSSGKKLCTLSGHEHSVHAIDFSQEGNILATGDICQSIKLWGRNVGGKEEFTHLKTFRSKNTPISYLSFTPQNLLIAAGVFRAS